MNNQLSSSDKDTSECTELLENCNSASQTVAALHVAFMAFIAYFGVIIWGTTHEDMLRDDKIKLPILDVELQLNTFFLIVPWLLVILHFNLLLQLELLARKLWNLDRVLSVVENQNQANAAYGDQVRDRLFIFPFTHLLAGRHRWLLYLVVFLQIFYPH
jgi:hypothetical protein